MRSSRRFAGALLPRTPYTRRTVTGEQATGIEIGAAVRRRAMRLLFACTAVGQTSYVGALTVATLVGQDLTDSTTLSGLPWGAAVFGTGVGSAVVSRFMAVRGRAPGLAAAYAFGGAASVVAVYAIASHNYLLFVLAAFCMGGGNSSNQLSRYAAADFYPEGRRASGMSLVVWAGTIGGVTGPALLDPAGRAATALGLPELAGIYSIAVAGFVLAALVLVPLLRAPRPVTNVDLVDVPMRSLWSLWATPRVRTAVVTLAVAQTVMVLIMAMTPLHMRSHGHGLGSVGLVISVHVFGMYGLSPLSGRLTDRLGSVPTALMGFALLGAAAIGAAAFPARSGMWLAIPLFCLGLGWSFSFVAGSALLTHGLAYAEQARLQGATDSVVWTSAALAGLFSGVLVGAFSYAVMCFVGALLLVAPVVTVAARRRAFAPQAA